LQTDFTLDQRLCLGYRVDEPRPAGLVEDALLAGRIPVALIHDHEMLCPKLAQEGSKLMQRLHEFRCGPTIAERVDMRRTDKRQRAFGQLFAQGGGIPREVAERSQLGAAVAGGCDLVEVLPPPDGVAFG